jgi:hypothetical protein
MKILTQNFISFNKLFLAFIIVCACHFAQGQSSDMLFNNDTSLLTIQTYGMPSMPKDEQARRIVACKWGFRYDHVADCVVSKELSEKVATHNNEVLSILTKKYGSDWEKNFEEEVKSEYKKERRIQKSLNKLPMVRKVMKDYERWRGSFFYSFEPDKKLEIYHVFYSGSALVDGIEGLFTFGKFIVDSRTFKINVVSDKVERFQF